MPFDHNGSEYKLNCIEYELEKINNKLDELQTRDTILIGLVQALVEKINPDSQFLLSLKAEDDNDNDYDILEAECPECGETFYFDNTTDPNALICPNCHINLSLFDVDDDDDEN